MVLTYATENGRSSTDQNLGASAEYRYILLAEMRRLSQLLTALILVFTAAIGAYSQTPTCPTITVNGPAGITSPGESFQFSATIGGSARNVAAYKWTVSKGTIAEGQGTDKIKVDVDWGGEAAGGIDITATVEILGLPRECPSTASETAGVAICFLYPILVDEYTAQPSRIDEARLSEFASEISKHPNNFAYVYEYFRPGTRTTTIERKNSLTKAALIKAGLSADYFKIAVVRGAEWNLTKLYRVPPGASNPTP